MAKLQSVNILAALESLQNQLLSQADRGVEVMAEYSGQEDLLKSHLKVHGLTISGVHEVSFWGTIHTDYPSRSYEAEGVFNVRTQEGAWRERKRC